MAVKYYTENCDFTYPGKTKTATWVKACVEAEGFRLGPVNYIFCSPDYHREMNRKYLGHDYYTDVITFDYSDRDEKKLVSGDIFIDPATVADNASALGYTPLQELRRVIIHGVLHLCGYADKHPDEERKIHELEDHYLNQYPA